MAVCEVHGNGNVQVMIQNESNPVLRDCKIHDGPGHGVFVQHQSQGTLQECEVSNQGQYGIGVTHAMPTIVNCAVHHCRAGLSFDQDSAGKVDGCDLYCNSTVNLAIVANGNPMIVGTAMRQSDAIGVVIMGNGAGRLENCRIVGNRSDGVLIKAHGDPHLHACQIGANGGFGISVTDQGAGLIEGCTLMQNARGSWNIPRFGKTRRKNNTG